MCHVELFVHVETVREECTREDVELDEAYSKTVVSASVNNNLLLLLLRRK